MATKPAPENTGKGRMAFLIVSMLMLFVLLAVLGWKQIQENGSLFGEPKPVDPPWMRGPIPGYVKLEAFTTNLPPDPKADFQYLQMAVDLKTDSVERAEQLKAFVPEIKSRVLRIAMASNASDLNSLEGKDHLADAITDTANLVAGTRQDKTPFAGAFFTSFLMQ